MTLVRDKIDAAIRQAHSVLTKPLGYKKRARSLLLPVADLYHVINFQGSQWGSADNGEFTISLRVIWRYFHEHYCEYPIPDNTASIMPSVDQRIGFLMPQKLDHWWHVDRNTIVALLAAEIRFVLQEFAFPFFAEFANVQALVSRLCAGIDVQQAPCSPKYLQAVAMNYCGDRAGALRVLSALVSTKQPQPWDSTVKSLIQSMGLEDKR